MKLILGLLLTVFTQTALANDFAAVIGVRSNSADTPSSGTVSSKTSFGAGVLGFFDFADQMQLRTGFLYNQRAYKITSSIFTTPIEGEQNLAYADIPLTLMYKFADYGGAFIGPVIGLLASRECKTLTAGTRCSIIKEPASIIVPIQLGVSFKFAPQMGAELYYEIISSEFWEDSLKNSRTIGLNFLYTFE